MAIIARSEKVPKTHFYPGFKPLKNNQVCILTQSGSDEGLYTSRNMVLSIILTTMFRWGVPIKSSNIRKISQLGIFFTWEIGREISEICDSGFFSRQHVGLEEYFYPYEEFYSFIGKSSYEVREEIK